MTIIYLNLSLKDFSNSNLKELLQAGVSMKPGMVIGDTVNGRKVSLGPSNDQKIVLMYCGWQFNKIYYQIQIAITSNLDYIFLKSAGSIENLNTTSNLVIEPLISTSKEFMIERYKMQFRADPDVIKDFQSQDKSYIIGARIKGEFNSAFSIEEIKKIELDTKKTYK